MFGFSVQLRELGPRDGIMRGECGRYRWEARMARGPVSYGLDPATLYKGPGRIVRLVLYEELSRSGAGHKVAAFDRGWLYGRKEHLAIVQRVVRYLEKQ
ncbi:MAG TPA: hypothetical protein VD969_29460 [Symbiobacteriaceae bacterium]|nr:hypothetical protein [Symbiobacteriaceae bacterium]